MAAFILSQLAGLVRSILILRGFGAGNELDAFNAANQVTDTLFALVAGGALASSFIPTFTSLLTKDETRKAWQLASAIANLVLLVLIALGALAAVFAPQIVRYTLAAGFAENPAQMELTVNLVRLMMPAVVLFGLSGLVMGILNSYQVFLVPALTPSMYSLGLIFGVLVLSPRTGIYGLGWGVLIGAALHLGLQIPSLLRRGGQYFPSLGLNQPAVREVGRLFGPRLFGVAVVHLNAWVNVWLASFQPEGSVTAIRTAFQLMLMPQAALAQSVATAAMPTLAAQYARGQLDEVRRSLSASLRGVLLLSIPASVGLMLLRRPLIVALYEGNAFDARSTDLVAWALLWYSAGLVGHSAVEILARAFYALHDTRTPVMIGAGTMSLNIVFSLLFSALFQQMGWMPHGGLALANSLATALETIGLLWMMRRRLGGLEGAKVWKASWKAVVAALFMAASVWLWYGWAASLPAWFVMLGGMGLGAAVYAALVLILGVEEARALAGEIARRTKVLIKR